MAEIKNTGALASTKKVYATDEAGMEKDAKDYASRDFPQTLEVVRKAGITEEQLSSEILAKALILVKLGHIRKSRLERVTFFD